MRDVASLARLAQAVALDRFGQDDGRLALGLHGSLVGGVHLFRIVAAAAQALQLFVRQVRDHLFQLGILAEEVLADVAARADDVFLILAVDDLAHALDEQAGFVARQQRIPVVAPDDLDDVPAGAAEGPFQFLDDLAVAAHRAVQPLQIAIDDEDQIVQLLARGQRDRAQAFRARRIRRRPERPTRASCSVSLMPRSIR